MADAGQEHECRPEKPIAADSLFRRANSLFGQKNSLFWEEQGFGCKLLNPLGDRLPKPPQGAEIVRSLQEFPGKFPVLRECTRPAPDVRLGGRLISNFEIATSGPIR